MADRFEWTFPSAVNCEIKGLNDSGVETFKGDTIASLAREICQNSLDAAISGSEGETHMPVEVEFVRFTIAKSDFPDRRGFADAVSRSREFWRDNRQATAFLDELDEAFSAEEIPCLRISDCHTTGLRGVQSNDRTKPSFWRSLVMSSGVSDKSEMSGGSFGIGKYASFSCSKFRTAFYATRTDDGYEGFQGVTRLVSFVTDEGETALGTGYCGLQDSQPLHEWWSLDSTYERTRPGTDIYIPAFVGGDDFRRDVICSVLDGFLYAIFNRRLVVRIDDEGESPAVTLDRVWLEKAYKANDPLLDGVRHTYEALKQPDAKWRKKDFGERGRVRLSLIANAKNLDKRIAMVRQPGMQIFKKDHFHSHVSFTGILLVEGGLNCELKRFENPQHTKWEKKRDLAHAGLLEEVYDFCREAVCEIVREDLGEELDSGLGDILPDTGDEGEPRKEETLDVRVKKVFVDERTLVKRKRQTRKTMTGGTPTGHASGSATHDGKNTKPTSRDIGSDGEKKVLRRDVGCALFRSVCRDRGRGAYRLKIVPEKNAQKGAVEVIVVAEIKDYPAPVKNARLWDETPLSVGGNEISGIPFTANEPVVIELTLDYSDYVSLEVACYEYK